MMGPAAAGQPILSMRTTGEGPICHLKAQAVPSFASTGAPHALPVLERPSGCTPFLSFFFCFVFLFSHFFFSRSRKRSPCLCIKIVKKV